MRTLMIATILLAGCTEFTGVLGKIGFASDLRTASGAWTPETPIAGGTEARVGAVELMGEEPSEGPLGVTGEVSGRRVTGWAEDDGVVMLTAERGHGWVHYSGAASDRFQVEFAPVADAVVVEPMAHHWGLPAEEELRLVGGSTWSFAVELRDRRGRALGYRLEDLEVSASGGASAWVEDRVLMVSADGDGVVSVSHLDRVLVTVPVVVVHVEDAVSVEPFTELHEHDLMTTWSVARDSHGRALWGVPGAGEVELSGTEEGSVSPAHGQER